MRMKPIFRVEELACGFHADALRLPFLLKLSIESSATILVFL